MPALIETSDRTKRIKSAHEIARRKRSTSAGNLLVYDSDTQELHTEIVIDAKGEISALIHPATYLNKIVVAVDNRLEIWNIRTGKQIHSTTFANTITSICASPVVDVIAVGLLNGAIIVHHLRAAEDMISLTQTGRVTDISFRTDGVQIMATSNDQGEIAFWNLEKNKIINVLRTAHAAASPVYST
ncbi:hypothetical protein MRB53_040438 [Persea americana]|nr:hypothetical protein MRB53_040438 [Persea americana]